MVGWLLFGFGYFFYQVSNRPSNFVEASNDKTNHKFLVDVEQDCQNKEEEHGDGVFSPEQSFASSLGICDLSIFSFDLGWEYLLIRVKPPAKQNMGKHR